MRKPVIAGNWKMNKTIEEGLDLIEDIQSLLNHPSVDVILCPPFTHLALAHTQLKESPIALGAQTLSEHDEGAFTGEISADMLHSAGVAYVIVGHSERRTIYKETNADINNKLKQAISKKLNPIFCVGETLEERESNTTCDVITQQLTEGLRNISATDIQSLDTIIAYEPVWAIGTGKVATPEQAQEVHAHIRKVLSELYTAELAQTIRLQYGGSVKPDNAKTLLSQPDIDGALVGGACLEAASFLGIIDNA